MMVSDTTREAITVAITAIGSPRVNFPAPSGSAVKGRNAKTRTAVQPSTATAICWVPARAAASPAVAHAQMPGDVFDDDDRIVDKDAQRKDEAGDDELVERIAQKPHRKACRSQG
jgi:hypothetical protein